MKTKKSVEAKKQKTEREAWRRGFEQGMETVLRQNEEPLKIGEAILVVLDKRYDKRYETRRECY